MLDAPRSRRLLARMDDGPARNAELAGPSRVDHPGRASRPDARKPFVSRSPAMAADSGMRFAACHPDGPRVHLAGAGAAAGRRLSAQGREAEVMEQIQASTATQLRDLHLAVRHNCPDVVQALNLMAVLNPRSATMIDGGCSRRKSRRADHGRAHRLPERREFGQGRMELAEILARRIDTGAAAPRRQERQGQGVRRADRRRRPGGAAAADLRRAQGHPHRRGGRALRRPGDGHRWASRTSSR